MSTLITTFRHHQLEHRLYGLITQESRNDDDYDFIINYRQQERERFILKQPLIKPCLQQLSSDQQLLVKQVIIDYQQFFEKLDIKFKPINLEEQLYSDYQMQGQYRCAAAFSTATDLIFINLEYLNRFTNQNLAAILLHELNHYNASQSCNWLIGKHEPYLISTRSGFGFHNPFGGYNQSLNEGATEFLTRWLLSQLYQTTGRDYYQPQPSYAYWGEQLLVQRLLQQKNLSVYKFFQAYLLGYNEIWLLLFKNSEWHRALANAQTPHEFVMAMRSFAPAGYCDERGWQNYLNAITLTDS